MWAGLCSQKHGPVKVKALFGCYGQYLVTVVTMPVLGVVWVLWPAPGNCGNHACAWCCLQKGEDGGAGSPEEPVTQQSRGAGQRRQQPQQRPAQGQPGTGASTCIGGWNLISFSAVRAQCVCVCHVYV